MVFGLVAAIYAVYLFLVLAEGFTEYLYHAGEQTVPPGQVAVQNWQFFYYFTTQSNILVLVFLVIFAVANLGDGWLATAAMKLVNQGVVLGLAIYMVVVFFVVACILDPFYAGQFEPVPTGGQLYEHVISPILILVIYLVYPLKGRTSARTVLTWMSYLLFYVVLANVVGAATTWRDDGSRAYPYDFLNPHNYPNVVVYLTVIIGLAVLVFLVGLALRFLRDRFDAGYRPDDHVKAPGLSYNLVPGDLTRHTSTPARS